MHRQYSLGWVTLYQIASTPVLLMANGARGSRGKGKTPKGKITPSMSERGGMVSEETRRINDVKQAMTKFRKGEATFNSNLLEFSQLHAFPKSRGADDHLYNWQNNMRKNMLTAIERLEQIDSDDVRDEIEYLQARLARLENACNELRMK